MKNPTFFIRIVALVAAMMCALGIQAAEAYANYTPSNTTLTFYYDDQRSSRPGTTYDLNTGSNDPGWLVDPEEGTSPVTKVVFNSLFADARPTTTYSWFYGMENLQSITGIEYLNTSEVTNMGWMFGNCTELTSLDLSHFNTSKVTEMGAMFYCCSSLTSLDLSSFNTSKVTRMPTMFNRCTNLRTVYVSNSWSTTAVTYSANMFSDCTSLVGGKGTTYSSSNPTDKTYAHIDGGTSNPGYFSEKPKESYACYTSSNMTLTFYYDNLRSTRTGTTYDLNTGTNVPDWVNDHNAIVFKVVFDFSFANARPTSTSCWFVDMQYLQTITDMNYLNTSEVTDMSNMFALCPELTSLDLSNFNTSKVIDMTGMFNGSTGLTRLDLSSFNTSKVTYMTFMFQGCSNLRTIYVGSGWTTAAVTWYYDDMFTGCTSLVGGQGTTYDANYVDKTYAHIDGGPSNPGYFTEFKEAYACYTSSNTTLTFYFDSQRSSRPGTTYDLNTGSNDPGWWTDGTYANVTKAVFNYSFANARPTSTCLWFYNMKNLQSITGMQYLNTSEVTDMSWMFADCVKLESLDVSHFNTTKVTAMNYMFRGCKLLTSLNVSNFNTAKVTTMESMFGDCSGLTSLDVSNFNTANVTNMSIMFSGCNSLTSLDLSNFNTAKVTDMSHMFRCKALTSIDLGSFNTSSVTNMGYMFYTGNALTSLDLSSFNTSKVTDMWLMFGDCLQLKTIYVGDGWSTVAVTGSDYMFYDCSNLVGGKGTTYDANHVDKAYAHVDGGPSDPGYFSSHVTFLRGDVNGDNNVSIADVTALIDYLLSHDASLINVGAADCNLDNNVSI
ncbi:MAG: BspA family leucine-rich repeat surface protein, partial [Muribaculaceae bacterium]|nr:BspA family leucine-rich repeat surface protein [Muribaculaceae bacterium]